MIDIVVSDDPALPVLEKVAEEIAYRWGDWLPFEDAYQSAWVWRISHPTVVQTYLDDEDMKRGMNGLERHVRDYLLALARKEKAAICGYSVDDEVFYTPAVVAELLPLTLDIEAALLPAAPADSDSGGGRVRNPYGQGDYLASLLDVRRAWVETPFRNDESRLIEARFCEGLEYGHIAASFSLEVDEVKRQIAIGLRRMTNHLGGFPGRLCAVDCPDCIERTTDL